MLICNVFFQKDEPDGEIDLISCLKVSEFDVEKNYGFQIQVPVSLLSSVSPVLPFSPLSPVLPPLPVSPVCSHSLDHFSLQIQDFLCFYVLCFILLFGFSFLV